jgi:hypothetical protein
MFFFFLKTLHFDETIFDHPTDDGFFQASAKKKTPMEK